MTLSSVLTYPFDLAYTRLASDQTLVYRDRRRLNVWDCFAEVKGRLKMQTLYQGVGVQLAASLIYVSALGAVAALFEKKETMFPLAVCGTAGLLEVLLYPLDTFKRCMQISKGPKYRTLYAELKGLRGNANVMRALYRGLPCHMIRVVGMLAVVGPLSLVLRRLLTPRPKDEKVDTAAR